MYTNSRFVQIIDGPDGRFVTFYETVAALTQDNEYVQGSGETSEVWRIDSSGSGTKIEV